MSARSRRACAAILGVIVAVALAGPAAAQPFAYQGPDRSGSFIAGAAELQQDYQQNFQSQNYQSSEARRSSGAAAAADRFVSGRREGRNDHHRYRAYLPLSRSRRRQGAPLRHRRRAQGLHLVRRREDFPQVGMAGLDSAGGNDRSPALPAALGRRRPRQSARRARALSRRYRSIASTAPTVLHSIGKQVSADVSACAMRT